MVGWGYVDAAGTQKAAFVYNDVVSFQLLNNLIDPASGWNLQMAQAINDAGDVVGWGIHNGQFRGFHLKIPLPHNTPGSPKAKVVHTTGYDGLRSSTTTAPGTPNARTQFWFSQDYTEHDAQREHYVRVGNRIVARITMVPDGMAMAGAATTLSRQSDEGEGKQEEISERRPWAGSPLWIVALAIGGLLGLLGVLRRPRWRRWMPTTVALLLVILPLASCQLFGLNQGQGASALWKVAPDATLYFHQGTGVGPSIITKSDATIFEERRYEPFGQPIDAYRDGVGVTVVDFLRDPQNSLGKMTDPTTGWSYHGARWMMPQTGRWTSPDPAVKAPDGRFMMQPWALNPYSYAGQSPTLFWDPSGLAAMPIRYVPFNFIGPLEPDQVRRSPPTAPLRPSDVVAGCGGGICYMSTTRANLEEKELTARAQSTVQVGHNLGGILGTAGYAIASSRTSDPDKIEAASNIGAAIDNMMAACATVETPRTPWNRLQKVGGRNPRGFRWAGQMHPAGVFINEKGFPDFRPFAWAEVKLSALTGDYAIDAKIANKAADLERTPDGKVWHHVEDGMTMQLIDQSIHDAVDHTGGSAFIKNEKK